MNSLNISLSKQKEAKSASFQHGISLLETMVGLALGLLITLVITQVWGNFESQKQRTVSGSSAHENGLLALTELEQDLRSAGAGLTDSAAFDCRNTYSYYENGSTNISPLPAYAGQMSMAPVQIKDGGAGSDILTIKRSGDFLGALPSTITSTMPSSSSELNIDSTTGYANGDLILAVDSATGNCTVMLITQVQGAALKLQHNPGGTTTYNPSTSFQNANGWPAYSLGAKTLKIGQLISHTYTVDGSNQLTLTDFSIPNASPTFSLATDIVKLKAQYGIADASSQNVNKWVNASSTTGWDILDSAKVKRIKAIRLIIVARSAKREGSNVTDTCTNISGGVNKGPCAWLDTAGDPAPLIDLSTNVDWKKYRYRVYQTIIPIRNVIWAGV